MTDTLFSPAFGNRPRIFVGREDAISGILRGLQEAPGSRERAVMILGQRGYGKTVLLLEVADMARKAGYVVASPTVVSSEMLRRILEKLADSGAPFLQKQKKQVTGGNVSILGVGAGIQFQGMPAAQVSFAKQLSDMCEEINQNGKGVLILIDELVSSQAELKQLIIAYQELVGEGKNIALIMAGLPSAVASAMQDHVLTFLNRAKKINLGPLRINDIECYYKDAFTQLGVRISAKLIGKAAAASEGSPYLMQLIGHYISLGAKPGCSVMEEELNEALDRAGEDFRNDICQTSLAPLSEKDTLFLEAMAQEEADEVDIKSIQDRLEVTPAYVQTYKRRLIQSGIIEPAGRGKVRCAIPYLMEYLKER